MLCFHNKGYMATGKVDLKLKEGKTSRCHKQLTKMGYSDCFSQLDSVPGG